MDPYEMWRRRLAKTPSGAPEHPAILPILRLYCTPDEADFLSRMPAKICNITELAEYYGRDIEWTQKAIDALVEKFLVGSLDFGDGVRLYTPAQIIPGFWDFTYMRVDSKLPVKELTRLFSEYWDTFYPAAYGRDAATQDFRVMVREESLPERYTEILDYESATRIVANAGRIAVGTCSCTTMKREAGKETCDRPIETCMSFNACADAILSMGQAREITQEEALDIIKHCKDRNMIQCADNVKNEPWYLCNCCKCCCGLFEVLRDYDVKTSVVAANYVAQTDEESCIGCGACLEACPIDAIELKGSHAEVRQNACIGCGLCVSVCKGNARRLERRPRRTYTPNELQEKFLGMALDRGKFGDQLFFDVHRRSHRVLGGLVNVFFKVPPVKQLFRIDGIKSRFLGRVARKYINDTNRSVESERKRLAGASAA